MKKTILLIFSLIIFIFGCSKEDTKNTPIFQGNYNGDFIGDATGTWYCFIDNNGNVIGSGFSYNFQDSFHIKGNCDTNGKIKFENLSTSATFEGQIYPRVDKYSVSGTWSDKILNNNGTFSGFKL